MIEIAAGSAGSGSVPCPLTRFGSFTDVHEPKLSLLTPREIEVLSGIGVGLSTRGIARGLGIRESTVKACTTKIFSKLGIVSRVQAALIVATHLASCSSGVACRLHPSRS
ncbi:response regulator transcription factor [Catenulispora sp. NL8]|uniref:Response regulator transcription factor n=1 Tax=Catenulispora pinistramenti TaxID=2705254 RepID=A0ABS5KN48_9ACTN|nr:LuxR C-terminal-related transcriptional regulator [Catenulispora pinistramenti]MBS2547434.1 response regulator transcription factor [Catenulispora pinistramenti]